MDQKKILNLKIDREKSEDSEAIIRVAKIKTEQNETIIKDAGQLQDVIGTVLNPINSKEAVYILMDVDGFEKLDLLLEEGFVLKVFETEKSFKVVITKDASSATFEADKEEGIISALRQSNEWAEEMLVELGIITRV